MKCVTALPSVKKLYSLQSLNRPNSKHWCLRFNIFGSLIGMFLSRYYLFIFIILATSVSWAKDVVFEARKLSRTGKKLKAKYIKGPKSRITPGLRVDVTRDCQLKLLGRRKKRNWYLFDASQCPDKTQIRKGVELRAPDLSKVELASGFFAGLAKGLYQFPIDATGTFTSRSYKDDIQSDYELSLGHGAHILRGIGYKVSLTYIEFENNIQALRLDGMAVLNISPKFSLQAGPLFNHYLNKQLSDLEYSVGVGAGLGFAPARRWHIHLNYLSIHNRRHLNSKSYADIKVSGPNLQTLFFF